MRSKLLAWAASLGFVVVAVAVGYIGPLRGLSGRTADALGDATRPYVLASPIFTPTTGTSFTILFTSYEDVSMSMLMRRYDAVGTLLSSQAITIGAHGSLQASPAAHSGAPLHVEIWTPRPHVVMQITYTNSSSVTVVVPWADMHAPDRKAGGDVFQAVSPFRVCDTRSATPGCPQAKLGPGGEIAVTFAGLGGVPALGAKAVVFNLTVTGGTSGGFLVAWPDLTATPVASALNFSAGQTLANMVTVKLGTNGTVRVRNALGQAHVILDVAGYYV